MTMSMVYEERVLVVGVSNDECPVCLDGFLSGEIVMYLLVITPSTRLASSLGSNVAMVIALSVGEPSHMLHKMDNKDIVHSIL